MNEFANDIYLNRDIVSYSIYKSKEAFDILIFLLLRRNPDENCLITTYESLALDLNTTTRKIKKGLQRLQRENLIGIYKQPFKRILIAIRESNPLYRIEGRQTYLNEELKVNITTSRNDKGYGKFRSEVLLRDKFSCQICGAKDNLEVHHIKEYAKFPTLRVSVSNGITLCASCHKKVHYSGDNLYGFGLDKTIS